MSGLGEASSFLGREAEIAAIDRLLGEGARIVTLVGPPGVGKTRIARRWLAGQTAKRRFVNLGPCRSAGELLLTVSAALEVHAPAASSLDEASELGRILAGSDELCLVLDNFEHLVRDAAAVVARFAEIAGTLRLVITSREPLHIAGEARLPIAPLPEALAMQLFFERAQALAPDLAPDARLQETVKAIVTRLDRIPLAIELAAARSAVLAPDDVLARLDERFELLGGRAESGARFARLETAIAWSWNLLDACEQEALVQCTVFASGFTVRDAEAVLSLEPNSPPILDVLQSLHDRSLLFARSGAGPRRLELYESVREFARRRVENSKETELRHGEHVVHEAEKAATALDATGGVEHVRRLTELHYDLLAVAERLPDRPELCARALLAAQRTLRDRGPMDEAGRIAERAVAVAAENSALRAEAEVAMAETLHHQGLLRDALERHARARKLAGSSELTARAQIGEALVRRDVGELEAAYALADDALDRAERDGFPVLAFRAQLLLGTVLLQLQHEDAKERCDDALQRARALGHRRHESSALAVCACLAHDQGAHDEAERMYGEVLAIARELDDARSAAIMTASIVYLDCARGELDRAARHADEASALARRLGDRRVAGYAELTGALVDALRSRIDEADARLATARTLLLPCGDRVLMDILELCGAAPELARAERAGDHETARAHLDEAQRRVARSLAPVATEEQVEMPVANRSVDARFLLHILEPRMRALATSLGEAAPPSSVSPKLEVAADGRWFRLRGQPRIVVAHRPILASVLQVLAAKRELRPGAGVSPDDLFAAAWRGERAVRRARSARVYVAISALRKLGLAEVLRRSHEGYMLDPGIPIERPLPVLDPS